MVGISLVLLKACYHFFTSDQKQAVELVQEELYQFEAMHKGYWLSGIRAKLGLFGEEEKDEELVKKLLQIMQEHKADFTNTFRALSMGKLDETDLRDKPGFGAWLETWRARLKRQAKSDAEVQALMQQSNPAIIPRNHRVEAALEAAVEHGNYRVMENLVKVLKNPYAYSTEQEDYCVAPGTEALGYRTYCGT